MQADTRTNRPPYNRDANAMDLIGMTDDYLRCLKRYWLQFLVLLAAAASLTAAYLNWSYEPQYTAKITYAVNKTGDTSVDAGIAKRLSGAVSTIANTPEFQEELLADVKKKSVNDNYQISAANTEGANLFTITVTSNNYKNSNLLLSILEKIYPEWASKSNGTVELQVVDRSEAPESPGNPYSLVRTGIKGILMGCVFCFGIATLFVLSLQTVRKESDMKKITSKSCIISVPEVKVKKRSRSRKEQLLLTNKRIDWGFKQSVQAAQARIEKQMEQAGSQVLLVSSTLPQEGKSLLAVNLALSFAEHEKKVLVIDGDLRNPSVGDLLGMEQKKEGLADCFREDRKPLEIITKKDSLDVLTGGSEKGGIAGIIPENGMKNLMTLLRKKYDYIVIDTPPSHLFTDASYLSRYADAVLYIVRHDYAASREIKDGMAPFIQSGKLIGYLINRSQGGFSSYGKYGYSKYGHYGKYKRYVKVDDSSLNTEDTL